MKRYRFVAQCSQQGSVALPPVDAENTQAALLAVEDVIAAINEDDDIETKAGHIYVQIDPATVVLDTVDAIDARGMLVGTDLPREEW